MERGSEIGVVDAADMPRRRFGWAAGSAASVAVMVMAMFAFATGGVSGHVNAGSATGSGSSAATTTMTTEETQVSSEPAVPTGTDTASLDTGVRDTGGGPTEPSGSGVVVDEHQQSVPSTADGGVLSPSNTYPYHSTGSDWPGLNTSDPRCAAILADQRILELPNMVGLTLPQAVASTDPIGLYSYCTNGTIIDMQFGVSAEVCTTDANQFDRVASQSPAAGTRVTPGGFPVRLTFYRNCPIDTSAPTTSAPPVTTAPPTTPVPTTPTTPATTPVTVPVTSPVTATPATGDPSTVEPASGLPASADTTIASTP